MVKNLWNLNKSQYENNNSEKLYQKINFPSQAEYRKQGFYNSPTAAHCGL